jgi:hypothetical protein
MRRLTASITAATVAIAIGLVIASVAGAARAAEFESMQARASAQNAAAATEAELAAYKQRLEEAYAQLNLTYQVLQSQDALVAAQAVGTDANVSAAIDMGASSSNVVAYAPVENAPVTLAAPATNIAPRSTPPPVPTRVQATRVPSTATALPATAAPVRTATGLYCWYDHDGKYVCEDHPQGQ